VRRWVLLWGIASAAAVGACGGKSRNEAAPSEAPTTGCEDEDCSGLPCTSDLDCPDGSSHYEACLPSACGLASVCHYAMITAGVGVRTLTCGCDGKVTLQTLGTGSPPAVFAYDFPGLTDLCDCVPDEICERSRCVGASCDATLSGAPELTSLVRGLHFPWVEGALVVAFDVSRFGETPNSRLIIGSGAMTNGGFSFGLSRVDARPTLLVDENADGACNAGELVLRYFMDLRATEGQILWSVPADEPPIPCEDRLPVR
jgi:hypothetical protein